MQLDKMRCYIKGGVARQGGGVPLLVTKSKVHSQMVYNRWCSLLDGAARVWFYMHVA